MSDIKIIPLTLDYLDAVCEVELDSFSIPWTRASLKEEIDGHDPIRIYYGALAGGELAGYAGMWHVVTEGHITNVAVKSGFRRRGVGSRLMEALIKTANEKEMIGLTLEVRVNNHAAYALYNKYGFKVEGIRKNYYDDTKEDALVLWKYF